jgi:hypothetical protein
MCPLQTEIGGHRFACILEPGHTDRDHFWWLAAPVSGPVPEWTGENLIEDDWGND